MTVTPFYFRFYICVQIFITIERILKFFFCFGRTVPLKTRRCIFKVEIVQTRQLCFNLNTVREITTQSNEGKMFWYTCRNYFVSTDIVSYAQKNQYTTVSIQSHYSRNQIKWHTEHIYRATHLATPYHVTTHHSTPSQTSKAQISLLLFSVLYHILCTFVFTIGCFNVHWQTILKNNMH